MMAQRSRRDFLADVGRGVLVATLGSGVACELGVSRAFAREGGGDGPDGERLSFGALLRARGCQQACAVQHFERPQKTEFHSG